MAEYSEADKLAFRLKDQLNARMSALKAASINNDGLGKNSKDILTEAYEYYLWLYPDQGDRDIPNKETETFKSTVTKYKSNIPQPNPTQAKVLGAVAKKLQESDCEIGYVLDYKKLCDCVYQKYGKYPNNMSSLKKILNEITTDELDIVITKNDFTKGE